MTDDVMMNWKFVPYESPIKITMYPLTSPNCVFYKKMFVLVPCSITIGTKTKTFRLLIPYKRLRTEIKSYPEEKQKKLLEETNEIILVKHSRNKLSIYLENEYIHKH